MLSWVKLSSMTSSQGDIGGVTFKGNEEEAQLFVSQQSSERGHAEFVISLWRSGKGIREIWKSGPGSEQDRLIALASEFESQLLPYREKARKIREVWLLLVLILSIGLNATLGYWYWSSLE